MRTLKRYLIVSFAILALIAQGCAGLNHANRVEQLTRDPKTIAFFLELDRVTHRYKAVDASTFRVQGLKRFLVELSKLDLNFFISCFFAFFFTGSSLVY